MSKKTLLLLAVLLQLFIGTVVFAQNEVTPPVTQPTAPTIGSFKGNCSTEKGDANYSKDCYPFLEAIPTSEGDLTSVDTAATGDQGIGGFINFAIEIGIGIAGILGVIMLTIYGFQYAAEDKNVATFAELRTRITSVVLGLLLLLGIFVILKTINPDLLIVEPEVPEKSIPVEERVNDPEFISTIENIDTSGITINLSSLDPNVLMYLMHQQGPSGAMAIVWSAKKGYASVPNSNPFTKSNINSNMRGNVGNDYQKVTGYTSVNPVGFIIYWQKKFLAAKASNFTVAQNVDEALLQASGKTGVGKDILRTMCKIESSCKPEKSNGSFHGLFQLSNAVFNTYVRSGNILDPYLNAFAGASYGIDNLAFANKYWYKITQ